MKQFFLTTLLLWILFPPFVSAKVWINELMQSNIDLVRDDLHEFPDSWIELYNNSDQPVNIQNWTEFSAKSSEKIKKKDEVVLTYLIYLLSIK